MQKKVTSNLQIIQACKVCTAE
uniref:Uncharacterized protein n=1 Tax=Arundo donax TaxID=35708 RepID=A0A0A9B310_ARUDO